MIIGNFSKADFLYIYWMHISPRYSFSNTSWRQLPFFWPAEGGENKTQQEKII